MALNYQPRGTSQNTSNYAWGKAHNPTAGDIALLQQNAKYELLSQSFVGSISVMKNSKDVTVQSQDSLLAITVTLTSASALAYQPTASPEYWTNGITDWLAVYNAQVAYAKSQGWV